MQTILVTGGAGFMGANLCVALRRQGAYEVHEFDIRQPASDLPKLAARADLVFHLAGVNRPKEEHEFVTGNAELTGQLCDALAAAGRAAPVVLSSSTQAELDNPYGRSKKAAENLVLGHHGAVRAPVYIYRFPNVFGKWSQPNYNTVVATFCHNISRGLPIQLGNREKVIHFVYIDDIVREFLNIAARVDHDPVKTRYDLEPVYAIKLGELHDLLVSFRENRKQSLLPDLSNPLVKYLYSTYVSFYDTQDFGFPVELRTDDRGWLFELVKSPQAGQVFVSRTRPGITRGNHYHDSKTEKFCVIQGEGVIRFRCVLPEVGGQCPVASGRSSSAIIEYRVSGQDIQIVDIPPGYTHSIENTGLSDMITLFWASEIFDPGKPDTFPLPVMP